MSRRIKLLVVLVGGLVLLASFYASLPWLITTFIQHSLTVRGASDTHVRVDYPTWHSMRLHALAFTAIAGEYQIQVGIPQVVVTYDLSDLITGKVTQIQVPEVTVQMQGMPAKAAAVPSEAALPPAALLTGEWLTQLPIRELILAQLQLQGRRADGEAFSLQSTGHLHDAKLIFTGDLRLPPPYANMSFALDAQATGETHLHIASTGPAPLTLLDLNANPTERQTDADSRKPVTLNGQLTTNLGNLLPRLASVIPALTPVSGLTGEVSGQWQAQVGESTWQVAGEVGVQNLEGRVNSLDVPASELTAQFTADPQEATFDGRLQIAKAIVLQAKGMYQLASGGGHADVILQPVMFVEGGFVMSKLLKDWPFPFDVSAGQISGSAQVRWQPALDLQGAVQLEKLGGRYNEMTFSGLNAELALAYKGGLRTRQDVHLHVDLVDVGFPVEQIDLRFALMPKPKVFLPVIKVQQFNAQLLGGRAHGGPFELDFGRDKNAFVVQLEQLDLHEIMQLEKQEGLVGSGKLDGQIPIDISSQGIVVTQGKITAREPGGEIRYTPTPKVAAMAQSNQGVGMMVKALSDFQYNLLEVNTDYKPGGDLVLQVRLEGHNPEWQKGQPIHLNLNLQENIPTLLRSLQLSDEISTQVQKRYQKSPK